LSELLDTTEKYTVIVLAPYLETFAFTLSQSKLWQIMNVIDIAKDNNHHCQWVSEELTLVIGVDTELDLNPYKRFKGRL